MKLTSYILLSLIIFSIFNETAVSSQHKSKDIKSWNNADTTLDISKLRPELEKFVNNKNARIGIAVICNDDTIEVNGRREFPMLSVYKFPQSLYLADYIVENGIALTDTVNISANEILPNTWSPLRDKYGIKDIKLPLINLLIFSLQQSDNNACDIIFRLSGGPKATQKYMNMLGYDGIKIINTEKEMHSNNYLCYQNRATPLEIASLFNKFASEWRFKNKELQTVDSLIRNCATGKERLAYPFSNSNIKVAHKTGTGDINSQGRIIAVNDAGYVELSNGRTYSIAVFIADSGYSLEKTSSMIAEISEIVYKYFK